MSNGKKINLTNSGMPKYQAPPPPPPKIRRENITSTENIEAELKEYFQNKYPFMDFKDDKYQEDIDFLDWIYFTQHIMRKYIK
jgi:hypothetical protein